MTGKFPLVRYGIPLASIAALARVISSAAVSLGVLAVGLVGFTAWSVSSKYSPRAVAAPVIAAPANPYLQGVSASGIIEPASEVVAIAVERGGVVSRVEVAAGAWVTSGQPLFAIDDREYRAVVAREEASLAAAQALLSSVEQSILLQRHTIAQATASLESSRAESARAELDRARYSVLARASYAPRQRLETAVADAEKAAASVAGAEARVAATQQEKEVLIARRLEAEAKLAQAKAALEQARVDLDRTVVRAPMDGTILKVNVRRGEYAQTGALLSPLMTMGRVDLLHIRADVDETDSWRISSDSPAVARLRGNPEVSAPLSFVRIEPLVLPKRSLTGDTTERVDTRVLQVIYALAPGDFPAFVGQQVDVFIETGSPQGTAGLRREIAGAKPQVPPCPPSRFVYGYERARGCRPFS